jgi:HEAT repeat protein
MFSTLVRSFALAVATALVAAAGFSEVQPGDQSRWSLEFRASMEQSSAHPIDIHIIGDWTSTVDAVRFGEYDAQLQLANIQLAGDAVKSAPAASIADLRARLSRPFWATFRSDGGLLSTHFYRDETPSDRNLLQMIATELQIVRPASSERTSWTAQERDGAGEYSALYVMPASERILKHKLKYIYTDGVAGLRTGAVQVAIEQSDITFLLASDGVVQQIDGANRVRMDLAQNQSEKLAAVTEFHAGNLRTGRASELAGSLQRELPNVVDSPIVTQSGGVEAVRTEADDRLLKGHTTETILAEAFAKSADDAPADRLTALFRRRPEAASAAIAMLMKQGAKRRVTNALGAAGTPSAVKALNGLAQNLAIAETLRVDAIVAFVQMQHPSATAMHSLDGLMSESNPAIRSAARMMSGALSHAGRAEHPREADAVDASLIKLYRSSHDVYKRSELLGALGNSSGPSVVPVVEEALRDTTSAVRAAAARALRLAQGAEIDQLLAGVITSDRDGVVRADAIFATRFRHPLPMSLTDALLRAASTDGARYVRSDAIAVLSQNPTASLRIPETLEQIAEHDPDPGLRHQAREALRAPSVVASTHPYSEKQFVR